jgi:hypothetical protein
MDADARPGLLARLARPENAAFTAAVAINAALTLFTAVWTLERFPNSGDEYAYRISAELFSHGRLSVPSPEPRHFFDVYHVLNDGKFYGKYPPGWPLLLAAGVLVGVPWLVNPAIGIATLFLIRAVARRHFPGSAASYAAVLLVANGFFVFNSASHFAHASCMFFVMLGFHGFLNWWEDPASRRDAVWAGVGAGMAFLIRPYTALLLLAPAGFAMLFLAARRRSWTGLALAAGPLFAAVGLTLLYNRLQTGDALLQPFVKYDAADRPLLPTSLLEFLGNFGRFAAARMGEMAWPWVPACWLLALPAVVRPPGPERRKAWLLAGSVFLLFAGYAFYPNGSGISYGPRYAYEVLAPLAVLMGAGCARFPRLAPNGAAVVLAVNAVLFLGLTPFTHRIILGKTEVYETVRREGITNAVVFLETGSGHAAAGDLTRNGITFDGPVLYLRDHGVGNRQLVESRPGRKPYVYRYDEKSGRGSLVPWSPPTPPPQRVR